MDFTRVSSIHGTMCIHGLHVMAKKEDLGSFPVGKDLVRSKDGTRGGTLITERRGNCGRT
jgi:hypothetical protein